MLRPLSASTMKDTAVSQWAKRSTPLNRSTAPPPAPPVAPDVRVAGAAQAAAGDLVALLGDGRMIERDPSRDRRYHQIDEREDDRGAARAGGRASPISHRPPIPASALLADGAPAPR